MTQTNVILVVPLWTAVRVRPRRPCWSQDASSGYNLAVGEPFFYNNNCCCPSIRSLACRDSGSKQASTLWAFSPSEGDPCVMLSKNDAPSVCIMTIYHTTHNHVYLVNIVFVLFIGRDCVLVFSSHFFYLSFQLIDGVQIILYLLRCCCLYLTLNSVYTLYYKLQMIKYCDLTSHILDHKLM